MRKVLMVVFCLLLMAGTTALAGGYDNDNGNGDFEGAGFGGFKIKSFAIGGGIDGDGINKHGVYAGGIGAAGGVAGSKAGGFVINGKVGGKTSAIGGGLVSTETYKINEDGVKGAGSRTETQSIAAATVKVKVNPKYGFGIAGGKMFGLTGQGSINGSILDHEFKNSEGVTYGVAGQVSVGGFHGKVFAMSGPYSKAGAVAGASIEMLGFSETNSYRYVVKDDGVRTEGMGTNVGAGTVINTSVKRKTSENGCAIACSNVRGGYFAIGGAHTKTVQATETGMAKASATGIYVGAGAIGTNYTGSAIGGTQTSVTTANGMNGSIQSASSHMTVTSVVK